MKMTNSARLTAGIDIGKEQLDAARHGQNGTFTVANSLPVIAHPGRATASLTGAKSVVVEPHDYG
jgi:hypothetical protein